MNIETWLALLLFGILAIEVAFSTFSAYFLGAHPDLNFPLQFFGNSSGDMLHTLLFEQAVAVSLVGLLLLVVLSVIIGNAVVKPLRRLEAAMKAFEADGDFKGLPQLKGAPKEIQTLSATFAAFAAKVGEAHKHDMEVSRVKSDFISTAAHQLRTPLTGIRWALEALANNQLTEDQKALVKNATDKSHELVAIVGTLLDISSIESGKYKYTFAPVDLDALLAEVAQDFSPLAVKTQVSLFYAKDTEPLPLVRADRERVKWVLNNLIENAIRYTPAGGTVHVSAAPGPGGLYVKVRDSGIGIPPKDRASIFERFYRAGNAIAKENAGNGLGLYIARTIATDHGGDLNFEANPEGIGTTFTLNLPLA